MDDLVPIAAGLTILLDPIATQIAAATLARESGARRTIVGIGVLVGGGLLALISLLASAILDLLNISPPAAQLAAGIVVLVPALDHLWPGSDARVAPREGASPVRLGVYPFGVPVLAGPATVVAVLAYGGAEGEGVTFVALVIGLVVVAGLAVLWRQPPTGRAARVLGAFAGAAMALVGFDLIWDGVFGT